LPGVKTRSFAVRQGTRKRALSSSCTLNLASPACGPRRQVGPGPPIPLSRRIPRRMGKTGEAASLGFRKGLNLINSTEHSVELSVCGLTSASPPPFTYGSTNESDFHATLCFLSPHCHFLYSRVPSAVFLSSLRWLVVRFLWTYVRGVICMTARRMDCESRTNEKVFA